MFQTGGALATLIAVELVRPADTGMQWGDEGNVGGEKSSGDKGGWEVNNENRHGGGNREGWIGGGGAGGGGGGVAHVRHVSFGSPRLANGNAAKYISTMLNNVQTSSPSQQKQEPSLASQNQKTQQPSQPQLQRQLRQSEQQQLQSQLQSQQQEQSPSQSSSSPRRLPKEQLPTGVSAPVMRLTHYRDIVPHNPFTTLGKYLTCITIPHTLCCYIIVPHNPRYLTNILKTHLYPDNTSALRQDALLIT